MHEVFRKFAAKVADNSGTPWAFLGALSIIIIWLLTGPLFHFSEKWQLVINTTTTIVTFLMVFLLQNAQNRDARATQLKLDELIHAIGKARDKLIDAEFLTDEELEKYQEAFTKIAEKRQSSGVQKEKKQE